jgi:MFS family permease
MLPDANDRAIVGLTMIGHALVHTYELSIPILMTIWIGEFETSTSELGLIVALGYALFGLGSLPGGILTDKYGSRGLIIACLAGMGAAYLLLSLANSLLIVTVALVLWGTAASVYHPSGLSLISKGVTQRGKAFAYHGIAGNAGIAVGPLATTILLLFFNWRMVAALLALPAVLGVVFGFRAQFREEATTEETSSRTSGPGNEPFATFLTNSRHLLYSSFAAVLGIALLSGLYYRGVLTFLPDLLSNFPTFETMVFAGKDLEPARYLYSGLLMVGMFGQYVGGRLTDSMDVERGLAISFAVLTIIALLFIPAAEAGLIPLLIVSPLLGFFLFVVQPLYQAMVAEYSPVALRGLSYGYAYLAVFGVGALGAALTGVLLDLFTPSIMFAVLAAFAGAATVISGIEMYRS